MNSLTGQTNKVAEGYFIINNHALRIVGNISKISLLLIIRTSWMKGHLQPQNMPQRAIL